MKPKTRLTLEELEGIVVRLFPTLLLGPPRTSLREPIPMGTLAWDRMDHGEGPIWITLRTTRGECMDVTGFVSRTPSLEELRSVMLDMCSDFYLLVERLLASNADYDKDRLRDYGSLLPLCETSLAKVRNQYEQIEKLLQNS